MRPYAGLVRVKERQTYVRTAAESLEAAAAGIACWCHDREPEDVRVERLNGMPDVQGWFQCWVRQGEPFWTRLDTDTEARHKTRRE